MADPRIHRYEVPFDDEWHDIELTGPIVHVAARYLGGVEFWSIHYPEDLAEVVPLRVFGTGQPIDCETSRIGYVGTALAGEYLVWHLMMQLPGHGGAPRITIRT